MRLLASDRVLLRHDLTEHFEHLSDESRFLRFLSAVPVPTDSYLAALVDNIDDHDHVAITVQILGEHAREDTAGGRLVGMPVGIGRVVRTGPGAGETDVAITVEDGGQGRSVGTLIAVELSRLVLEREVHRFMAISQAQNYPIRAVLAHAGVVPSSGQDGS